jgi:hypothetical protein
MPVDVPMIALNAISVAWTVGQKLVVKQSRSLRSCHQTVDLVVMHLQ